MKLGLATKIESTHCQSKNMNQMCSRKRKKQHTHTCPAVGSGRQHMAVQSITPHSTRVRSKLKVQNSSTFFQGRKLHFSSTKIIDKKPYPNKKYIMHSENFD